MSTIQNGAITLDKPTATAETSVDELTEIVASDHRRARQGAQSGGGANDAAA